MKSLIAVILLATLNAFAAPPAVERTPQIQLTGLRDFVGSSITVFIWSGTSGILSSAESLPKVDGIHGQSATLRISGDVLVIPSFDFVRSKPGVTALTNPNSVTFMIHPTGKTPYLRFPGRDCPVVAIPGLNSSCAGSQGPFYEGVPLRSTSFQSLSRQGPVRLVFSQIGI